ncbi:MAG: flagellar biosynthetic protein FliO [Candidatus Omnitrophota bacterium]
MNTLCRWLTDWAVVALILLALVSSASAAQKDVKAKTAARQENLSSPSSLAASASPALGTSPLAKSGDDVFQAVLNAMNGLPSGGQTANPPRELITNVQGESAMKYAGRMLMSLAFVVLLVLALAWAAKRFILKKHTLGGGHIDLLASYALSQKSQVHLIRTCGETFLIGDGGGALSLISKVEFPSHPDEAPSQDLFSDSDEEINPLLEPPAIRSFDERLTNWQKSLDEQNLSQEVKASLLLLGGLSERLRRKGGNPNA